MVYSDCDCTLASERQNLGFDQVAYLCYEILNGMGNLLEKLSKMNARRAYFSVLL